MSYIAVHLLGPQGRGEGSPASSTENPSSAIVTALKNESYAVVVKINKSPNDQVLY